MNGMRTADCVGARSHENYNTLQNSRLGTPRRVK